MNEPPEISIIIATYRRYQLLLECLESLSIARQNCAVNFEVIVVDDGGALPREIERQVSGLEIRWVYLEQNLGQPGAQAVGVQQARGEILAFLDDDAIVAPHWPQVISRYLRQNPDIGAVLGKIEAVDLSHILARMRQQIYDRRHRLYTSPDYIARLKAEYNLTVGAVPGLSNHISGGNFAIRRTVLASIGGLAESVRLGCDDLMSQRLLQAGQAIGYLPEMVIYHHHNQSFRTLFRNNFHEGRDRVRIAQLSGSSKLIGQALLNLFRVPFRIIEFPEMLAADRNAVLVYGIYTCVQLFDALGQIYQAVSIWAQDTKAMSPSSC